MLITLIDWILHLDKYLSALATEHSTLVYVLLFAVIFIETGVVVLPFLPGDSLLFVAGALAAKGMFSLPLLMPLLIVAGDRIKAGRRIRFIKPEYLARTEGFFDRHGRKTIVLARYVPVVRTFAPFVAALGNMHYGTFLAYNLAGGTLWVMSLLGAGYAFGNVPWVSQNLTAVLLGIIALSLLPGLVAWLQEQRSKKAGARDGSGIRS
jgi:membrane-associated protein